MKYGIREICDVVFKAKTKMRDFRALAVNRVSENSGIVFIANRKSHKKFKKEIYYV